MSIDLVLLFVFIGAVGLSGGALLMAPKDSANAPASGLVALFAALLLMIVSGGFLLVTHLAWVP